MISTSREHLLGYLLGALERSEHEQLEAELDQDPALRAELCRLEKCIGRLGLSEECLHPDPPFDLAARTCRFVAEQSRLQIESPSLRPMLASSAGMDASRRFRWSDLLAAAAVLIVAASLFFPALSYSRFRSQIAACQNQIRLIGLGFHQFSDLQPDGSFPGAEASGNRAAAGFAASLLAGNQLLPSERTVLCASSPAIRQIANFRVPRPEEVDQAKGPMLVALQRTMGGDYGYTMGYAHEGKLKRPGNARRSEIGLVSDAPSDRQPARTSANHYGRGQNVFFEDGSIKLVVDVPTTPRADDPFHNRDGLVAAGLDGEDAVLGASADQPFPMTISQ